MAALILASQSPRRQELLHLAGVKSFRTLIPNVVEQMDTSLPYPQLVQNLAKQKALAVAPEAQKNDIIIAADTIVVADNTIFGKPKDPDDARQMLSRLSANTHRVYTGLALLQNGTLLTDAEQADVFFRQLSSEEIDAYILTGEPMDKAGAYGIQGKGALFVTRIEGDYYTVMGLPLCTLSRHLMQFHVNLMTGEGLA